MALKPGRVYKEDYNCMYYSIAKDYLDDWCGLEPPDLGVKPHTWWEEIGAELNIGDVWNAS